MLAVVDERWLREAEVVFQNGRSVLSFVAGTNIGLSPVIPRIRHVYFKPHGVHVLALAECIRITDVNPKETRLPGYADETGKFYYSFSNLRWIKPNRALKFEVFQYGESRSRLTSWEPPSAGIAGNRSRSAELTVD